MLKFEPHVREERGLIVDGRGNAYCLGCLPIPPSTTCPDHWATDPEDRCDRCGRPARECPPLLIEGTAAVEFPRVKIF